MKNIQEEIKQGCIAFVTHSNAPAFSLSILEVVQETEKAVNVKHEHTGLSVWVPKSAFEYCNHAFTLKKWFRAALQKNNNNYVFKALGFYAQ